MALKIPRVALVTGGMGGLGEAICIKLAGLGYKVVTTYPTSRKAADASLKVDFCQYELNSYRTAKATLQKLAMPYPGTETGRLAEERLHEVKLTVNRNTVPFDERPPTVASGIRIGTPAVTMRGFDEEDFKDVGEIIVAALADSPDVAALAAQSEALCAKRPLYPGFRGFPSYA